MLLVFRVPWYLHWRNAVKPILLNFVKLQLTLLQKPWVHFFLLGLNRQPSRCRRVVRGNWWVFLRWGSEKPVVRWNLLQFWKSLTFICLVFSITAGSFCSIKLSIPSHFFAENVQKENFFCVSMLTVRKRLKILTILTNFDVETHMFP